MALKHTEVDWLRLCQVSVIIRSVCFLQARAKTKIGEFQVAICINQKVVWFDVPMDEAELVDGVDCQHRLGHVKLSLVFCQGIFLHQ